MPPSQSPARSAVLASQNQEMLRWLATACNDGARPFCHRAHTILEFVRARWGTAAHIVFSFFCVLTNCAPPPLRHMLCSLK